MQTDSAENQATNPATDVESGGFYVQDVDFRSGVVMNQTPSQMALVAAIGGYLPPDTAGAFTYCDLGCGDGTTVNALAEQYPEASFVGIDFNPGHITTARETAKSCGLTNVRFVEASFSGLADKDLPVFDFVGMNGIYAWMEEPEAKAVRGFLNNHLRTGGLFYVEYTSLPGKISVQPLWGLVQYLVPPDDAANSRERAQKGLALTEALAKRGMAYLNAHRPAANGAQSYIRGRRRDEYRADHFAHNAMASGFRPRYVTEMAAEMAEADLTLAGRTELTRNEIELCVPPAQVPTFQDYKDDPITVELLKDYIRNEQQRRDVFVKNGTPDRDAADAWLDTNLRIMARMPANRLQRFITTMGNHRIPLRGPAFEALIKAGTEGTVTPAQIAEQENLPVERVRKAALRLLASNQFFLCRRDIQGEVPDGQSLTGITLQGGMNRRTLRLAVERLMQNLMLAPATGEPNIPVSAIEAVLLQGTLDSGSFEGAPAQAREHLSEVTHVLPTPNGNKPGKDITESDLRQVLDAMRGQKLTNMLRLGIVTPKD